LSHCLKIGRAIRIARDAGTDPVVSVLNEIEGWRLFDGRVSRLDTEDRDGYYFGTIHIDGQYDYQGQIMKVWFKNENLVTWLNEKPWVCSPDLVSLIYRENGRGIYNAELVEGDEVVVVGMKGVQAFRTEKGLELAGPGHFGFDIKYTPIEKLLPKREVT